MSNSVKIEKLLVPEVVPSNSDNTSEAVLDCIYGSVSDVFTVKWFFNGNGPVYEWSPHTEPRISGILEGRLDLSYRLGLSKDRRALRIISLAPELSGDYTCTVSSQGKEDSQTKSMLVFSPERDLLLEFDRQNTTAAAKCIARGLYPQPELILEHNGIMFKKQQLRLWRSEGLLYDAESTASLEVSSTAQAKLEQVTCRLHIPQAGYTAIKKELLFIEKECGNSSSKTTVTAFTVRLLILSLVITT